MPARRRLSRRRWSSHDIMVGLWVVIGGPVIFSIFIGDGLVFALAVTAVILVAGINWRTIYKFLEKQGLSKRRRR